MRREREGVGSLKREPASQSDWHEQLIDPIRAGVGADNAARRTDHARAKGGHRNVVPIAVRVNYCGMPAKLTPHDQTTHAVRRMLQSVMGGPL